MNIYLHPDDVNISTDITGTFSDGDKLLWARESKSGTSVTIVLTPELEKKLIPLQDAEKKKIADEAFERGVIEGKTSQAILELKGRDKFLAELRVPQEAYRV